MCTKALPMPSVLSLIFPIEEAGVTSTRRDSTRCHQHTDSIVQQLKKFTRPRTAFEKQLSADVTFFRKQLISRSAQGASVDIVDLACSLAHLGHEVKVRYAEGGGPNCFRNLFHEFLLVKGKGDCAGTEIVVEPSFCEHFLIPCATPAYTSFYEHLPSLFVGPVQQLAPLVELIAHEMSRAFAEAGITMPPWRGSRAVMSKWAPQRATDRLPSEAASPQGTSLTSSTDLERPSACLVHQSDSGIEKRQSHPARREDRRGSTGSFQPLERIAGPSQRNSSSMSMTVGSLGTVQPAPCGARLVGARSDQARHLRRLNGSTSPSLSLKVGDRKVGFEFPDHTAGT